MSAPSYNCKIDAFVLPLDAYYMGKQQDTELTLQIESFKTLVRQFISSPTAIKTLVDGHLDALFSFRMSALKWLIANDVVFEDIDPIVENELASFKEDPSFSVLYQNVLFAIRVNVRSMNALIGPATLETLSFDTPELVEIADFSFTEYLTMLNSSIPNAVFMPLKDWLTTSLYIEFGILSTFIIHREKWTISKAKVHELAAFIADSAQEFGAISKELMPSTSRRKPHYPIAAPDDFLAEELFLAEQDIEFL